MTKQISQSSPEFVSSKKKLHRGLLALCAAGSLGFPSVGVQAQSAEAAVDAEDDALIAAEESGTKKSKASFAELNAFGCEGVGGAVFAGRYQNISVFANMASLTVEDATTQAKVFGDLAPGLLPPMLSAAFIQWKLTWKEDDDSLLLHGQTLRPDGAVLTVRLKLPYVSGVVEGVIRVINQTTGEKTKETIVCTVR